MRSEIAVLLKKKLIEDVTAVSLEREMLVGVPTSYARVLRGNAKRVDVFRFFYRSQGLRVAGYMALPKKLEKKMPCIIYNRGGSLEDGKISPRFALGTLSTYATWGYAVIGSQYRGNDGGEGREEHGGRDVDDVLRLRDVLAGIAQTDTNRIGMIGWSRGGMMTYLAAARVSWLKATATVAGLSDVPRNVRMRPEIRRFVKKLYDPTRADLISRSAVHWPQRFSKRTPMLLLHGTADRRISPLDSVDLSKKLLAEGVPHRLVLFEGGDHALSEFRDEMMGQIRSWFERFVTHDEPMPNMTPHGK